MAQILIVDDNTIMHRTLTLIIRKTGHQTLVAADGLKAIEIIASTTIDLAIVDMTMPHMSGLELVKHIRSHETDTRMPIVFLTGSGRESDHKSAVELGIDGFLTKPVSSHELREKIDQLLSTQQA
ncbi:MAG: response regulator [Anaerolineae bacterium]